MIIARDLLQRIVDHAQREKPAECCGYLVLDGERVVDVVETENLAHSPYRFDMDPKDIFQMAEAAEDGGAVIYHSHTRSAPRPSETDMNFAAQWPGIDWLIVGVKDSEPEVRNWRIAEGVAAEVEVEVDGDGA